MKFNRLLPALAICLSLNTAYAQRSTGNISLPLLSGDIGSGRFNKVMHFRLINGEIFITVIINGKEYNFLFDTGAGTVISPQLAQDLGLEETGYIKTSDGRGGMSVEKMYVLDSVTLGGVSFRDISCVRINTDAISATLCAPVDGIIGASLMRLCYWQINFADETLAISSAKPAISTNAAALRFLENDNGSPFIRMRTGDSLSYIEFDTGSNNPLTLDDSTYFNSRGANDAPYATMYGNIEETIYQQIRSMEYRLLAPHIELDTTAFSHVLVNARDLKHEIQTIGTSFMKNYEVTLDWKDDIIYLNRVSDTVDGRFTTSLGLSVALTGAKLNVALVWKGSEAEKSGIAPGNEIISVNGESTQNLDDADYCRIKESLRDMDAVKMVIRTRDNRQQEYELRRYRLL